MIKLDIISDPICPWCYIGKTYLDRALEEHPNHPFEIEWHPFQLNPGMPAGGMDRRQYLEQKFGGKEAAIKVYSQIERAAAESQAGRVGQGVGGAEPQRAAIERGAAGPGADAAEHDAAGTDHP